MPLTLHHGLQWTALAMKGMPTFGSKMNASCCLKLNGANIAKQTFSFVIPLNKETYHLVRTLGLEKHHPHMNFTLLRF